MINVSTATFAGYRTRVLATEGSGPRLVFLHGYCDSADSWRAVMRILAAHGIGSIAVDLPGFGRADRLAPGPVLPQLRAFGRDLVQTLGTPERPVVLIGNSLGSCTALLSAEDSAVVSGVVATAEPTLGRSWLIDQFRRPDAPLLVRALLRPPPIPAAALRLVGGLALRLAMRGSVRHQNRRGVGISREAVDRFVDEFAARGLREVADGARRLALETPDCYRPHLLRTRLLVVHGQRDLIIPTNAARTLHGLVPGSTLMIRREWGHCPQLEDPSGLSRTILDFLATLPPLSQEAVG